MCLEAGLRLGLCVCVCVCEIDICVCVCVHERECNSQVIDSYAYYTTLHYTTLHATLHTRDDASCTAYHVHPGPLRVGAHPLGARLLALMGLCYTYVALYVYIYANQTHTYIHTYTHMNTHLWCVHEQQRVASVAHSFVLLPHTGVAARAFATLARAQHLRVGVSRGTFVRVGGCEWQRTDGDIL
jgi:hypothetical protein